MTGNTGKRGFSVQVSGFSKPQILKPAPYAYLLAREYHHEEHEVSLTLRSCNGFGGQEAASTARGGPET